MLTLAPRLVAQNGAVRCESVTTGYYPRTVHGRVHFGVGVTAMSCCVR